MNVICPKCNTIMTKAIATSAIGKFSAIKETVIYFTTKESSQLIPHVCSKCGYTEWYVMNPEKFKTK